MPWTKALDFFKEVRAEMQKVSWPSREQTIRLSAVVLGITFLVGLYVGALDILFTKIATSVFTK
jgi:preprotein translocase subunit SecE